ncbi:MAG TPA: DNA polymerase III subunit gamma/tau [Geminicoccaceae bacterium]|nr:DNA polymerase III subunit gamma/tau [Geminicoccaceae bacterium]
MPAEPAPSLGRLTAEPTARPYRVLARTYRPQRLSELIGQDALVRTLANALRSGRVAHAFLLTGIRGVGKTTTARIIARALNCVGADGHGQPTPEPCGVCEPCVAIAEGRHVDVLEMDAATRTGIDDIREIVDSVRYAPSSARHKVYIIDEVHMLSEKAFNGLLKTLEEPPPQTIFIFATTEVRKVPVTVLSRCQRFDLRRIDGELLQRHLVGIAEREQVPVDPGALALIVRAAEGSVRDGLSLLDQAMALAAGDGAPITAAHVQAMLGLADRSRVLDLFEQVARGAIREALDRLAELYKLGSEPEAVLQDLLEISHWLTRIKVAPEAAERFGVAQQDVVRGRALAEALSVPVLARAWQMLLKGLDDVRLAPSPLLAAEMVLVRLAYAADLPPPSELVRRHAEMAVAEPTATATTRVSLEDAPALAAAAPETPAAPAGFAEAVALFERRGEPMLHGWLYQAAELVHFEPGRIELRPVPGAPPDLFARAAAALGRWTGRPWLVALADDGRPAEPTLAEQAATARRRQLDAVADDPRVKPVLEHFPGAAVVDVRPAASR